MNNYCRNCGEKLESDAKVCHKCRAEVFEKRINVEQWENELEEYKKKENKYFIIIISLYALACSLYFFNIFEEYNFISFIRPLLFLGATIFLIYARSTMNKSKKIRILFNIFIIFIILFLLFTIYIFSTCTGILKRGCY